jgi:asparagine synthase (glutamine-hydrolysing)
MLMGNAVEGRFPYLDPRVAAFAAGLPDGLRQRGLRDKRLLRQAVASLLPPDIARRPKRPYRAPILRAFTGPGAPDYVGDLLRPARLADTGVFSQRAVGLLWDKCRRNPDGEASEMDGMAFVGILSLQLLHERMVRAPELAPAPREVRRIVNGRTESARLCAGVL